MEPDNSVLRKGSILFWCAVAVPLGIIVIGINFILNPIGASIGYGIPNHHPDAFPYMWIKGIRDICAGLVILPFLLRGNRQTTGILYAGKVSHLAGLRRTLSEEDDRRAGCGKSARPVR
jgi:hypothetical protein